MIDLEDMSPSEILDDIAAYMIKRGVPHYSVYFDESLGRWRLLGPKSDDIAGALREAADHYELSHRPDKLN